jgi:phosphoesterase RecJ-like protein
MSINNSHLISQVRAAKSLILTTHKQCDGDGLGAMIGLYHALKKAGKKVRVLTVDGVAKKYSFLQPEKYSEVFEMPHSPFESTDLALIFDTNDKRLVEPLWSTLEKHCKEILFIDHHPILNQGPTPTEGSLIDVKAASTGEMVYAIIKALGLQFDSQSARAIYASIVFDTQLFRYVRGSKQTHLICAELLEHNINPEDVHRHLFATHSAKKMAFMAGILSQLELAFDDKVAFIIVSAKELKNSTLDVDDTRDLIDMVMNIDSIMVAILFREDAPGAYKLSFRSKGFIEVLSVAESLGGGGHMFASGAFVKGSLQDLKAKINSHISELIKENSNKKNVSKE